MKIKSIIETLKRICKETNIAPDDNTILEVAEKIYVNNKINESKKENIQTMKDMNRPKSFTGDTLKQELATEKQVLALIKMGFKGNIDKVTKKEAWEYINSKRKK